VADKRPPVSVRSVNCPNCGAATAVRTFGHAVNVVCMSCRSILDAQDAGVTILQKYRKAVPQEPLIPLGTRGTLPGETIQREVVGFQVRQITVDDVDYQWREYLLFNPYHGFRYLTEYAGHWNVVSTLRSLPDGDHMPAESGTRGFDGESFRHFQTATATTVFVLGEFPWQVRVGDKVTAVDYVAPPRMLSAEVTADQEVIWSIGQYVAGAEIWKGLALPGDAPAAEGVFADQPSPFARVTRRMWRNAALLLAVATVLWIFHLASARSRQVFTQAFQYDPRLIQDASLVTPIFELDGRPSAVRIETQTDLDNQWMGVGYALVNDDTGQSFEFAREVSFYAGVEDGESWTEGSRADTVTLPTIPPGRYFLRIEPEGERIGKPVRYRVNVIEDVATSLWYVVTLILVLLPPIVTSIRAAGFETRRWAESDHGSSATSDDDDDDDGDDADDD
jgi:ribosomal protein S27E